MWMIFWVASIYNNTRDGLEPTDRLTPASWVGNPWGPEATRARKEGSIPPVVMTPEMRQWDRWGKAVLKDGDILFRRGDAKLLHGYFPFSRFLANCSGSQFSHTGIAAIEDGERVVYDVTKAGVRRQPFGVWVLDNVGPFGVKRVKPEFASYIPKALAYCRNLYQTQPPFDFELNIDDRAFYCLEMTEKAYRTNGLPLAEPVLLGDMENVAHFPIIVMCFLKFSPLRLEQPVFFPGNDRHGIWSSKNLMTVYAPPPTPLPKRILDAKAKASTAASPAAPRPAAPAGGRSDSNAKTSAKGATAVE